MDSSRKISASSNSLISDLKFYQRLNPKPNHSGSSELTNDDRNKKKQLEQGFSVYFNGDAHRKSSENIPVGSRILSAPTKTGKTNRKHWQTYDYLGEKFEEDTSKLSQNIHALAPKEFEFLKNKLKFYREDLNVPLEFERLEDTNNLNSSDQRNCRSHSCDNKNREVSEELADKINALSLPHLRRIKSTLLELKMQNRLDCIYFEIKSNWGHPNLVGFAKIIISRMNDHEIPINDIIVNDNDETSIKDVLMKKSLNKRVGQKQQMWTTSTSRLPFTIRISSSFDFEDSFKVILWNYNDIKNINIGVKDFSIYTIDEYHKRKELYIGSLPIGSGNPVFNFSSTFIINSQIKYEDNVQETVSNPYIRPGSMQEIFKRRIESGRDELEKSWQKIDFFEVNESRRQKRLNEFIKSPTAKHVKVSESTTWSDWNKNRTRKKNASISRPEFKIFNSDFELFDLKNLPSNFMIPELPEGKELVIDILSTWGDIHYVGLTGIDVFNNLGENLSQNSDIQAEPPDINILPEYENDPRVVLNLTNGINQTKDDIHMWLAPYEPGGHHLIKLTFPKVSKIALIRVWNYNKSRVHADRGAKYIIIYYDEKVIFQGEVQRSSGIDCAENEGVETILFTTNEKILEAVANNDPLYKAYSSPIPDVEDDILRPSTGVFRELRSVSTPRNDKSKDILNKMPSISTSSSQKLSEVNNRINKSSEITIRILSNWLEQTEGWVAFDALQILDENNIPIVAKSASYLVDGSEFGDSMLNMIAHNSAVEKAWFGAFLKTHIQEIKIILDDLDGRKVESIKFWNCNTSAEDTGYGIKLISISTNFSNISDSMFIMRKAFHLKNIDYSQVINLNRPNYAKELENNHLPTGFILQINIYMSWFDPYYVGLNGLTVFDKDGREIQIESDQIHACPSSVNELAGTDEIIDIRTPDKLVDNINEGEDASKHSWLAPIFFDRINKIYIVFNDQVSISGIKFWNYSKTPNRGVRDFAVLMDGKIVSRACLPIFQRQKPIIVIQKEKYSAKEERILAFDTHILESVGFSKDEFLSLDYFDENRNHQNVKLINIENEKVPSYARRISVDEALRPTTSLPPKVHC